MFVHLSNVDVAARQIEFTGRSHIAFHLPSS